MWQEEKKKFEKQTAKFVQSQERHLNLSTKKQDSVLQEVSYLFSLLPLFSSIITCSWREYKRCLISDLVRRMRFWRWSSATFARPAWNTSSVCKKFTNVKNSSSWKRYVITENILYSTFFLEMGCE